MITVVAGMPRSGTSLMMAMLRAGGMPLYYDHEGSWETEKIMLLPHTHAWLAECDGKAVKMLDPHHATPPKDLAYRFIWMDRNDVEQAKSTVKFMRAMGVPIDRRGAPRIAESIRHDRHTCLHVLRERGPMARVQFERLLRDPRREAERISAFCGGLDVDAMCSVVIDRPPTCLPYLLEERYAR